MMTYVKRTDVGIVHHDTYEYRPIWIMLTMIYAIKYRQIWIILTMM